MTTEELRRILRNHALEIRERYFSMVRQWHQERGEESDAGARPIPRYDGGPDRFDRFHKPVWPVLAAFCRTRAIDPIDFVSAQFDEINLIRILEPSQMMGPAALSRYSQWKAKFAYHPSRAISELEIYAFEKAKRSVRMATGATERSILRSILMDTALKISMLVRYCLAKRDGEEDLAERFFPQALREYMNSPRDFEACLPALIPRDLRDRVIVSTDPQLTLPPDDELFTEPIYATKSANSRSLSSRPRDQVRRAVDLFTDD